MNSRTFARIVSVKDAKGTTHQAIQFRVDYRDFDQTTGYEPTVFRFVKDLVFHNGRRMPAVLHCLRTRALSLTTSSASATGEERGLIG